MFSFKTHAITIAAGSALIGSALFLPTGQAQAGPLTVAPVSSVALPPVASDVAYRKRGPRAVRHVTRHRRVAVRRYHRNRAVPAAAFGILAAGLGAAIASNGYGYGYGYPDYGYGYYPAYSYGYNPGYSYGYYPRYRNRSVRYYGGPRYGHRAIYNRPGAVRAGFYRGGGYRGGAVYRGGAAYGGGRYVGGGRYGGGQRMGITR